MKGENIECLERGLQNVTGKKEEQKLKRFKAATVFEGLYECLQVDCRQKVIAEIEAL